MYKVFETDKFIAVLNKLDPFIQDKLYQKVITYIYPQLKIEPNFGKNIKKLKNYNPETWRYRIGKYRLFYEIDENQKIVLITYIEIRGKAY